MHHQLLPPALLGLLLLLNGLVATAAAAAAAVHDAIQGASHEVIHCSTMHALTTFPNQEHTCSSMSFWKLCFAPHTTEVCQYSCHPGHHRQPFGDKSAGTAVSVKNNCPVSGCNAMLEDTSTATTRGNMQRSQHKEIRVKVEGEGQTINQLSTHNPLSSHKYVHK